MEEDLGRLAVGVQADIKTFLNAMDTATRRVKQFSEDASRYIGRVEASVKSLGGGLTSSGGGGGGRGGSRGEGGGGSREAELILGLRAKLLRVQERNIEASKLEGEAAEMAAVRTKASIERLGATKDLYQERTQKGIREEAVTRQQSVLSQEALQGRISGLRAKILAFQGRSLEAIEAEKQAALSAARAQGSSLEELGLIRSKFDAKAEQTVAKQAERQTKIDAAETRSIARISGLRSQLLKLQGNNVGALELEGRTALIVGKRRGDSLSALTATQNLYNEKIKQAKDQQNLLTKSTDDTSQAITRLTGMIQRMVGAFVIFKVIEGFQAMISQAFEFNKIMENSRMGIASLISGAYDFKDAFGRAASEGAAFGKSLGMAEDAVKRLQKINVETIATLPELINIYQQIQAVAGTLPGATIENLTLLSKRFSLLLQQRMIPQIQAPEEIRAVIEGRMHPGQTRVQPFFTGLGIDNPALRSLRETGKLIPELIKITQPLEELAKRQGGLWDVAISTLKDRLSAVLGEGFRPLFEYVKSNLMVISQALSTPKGGETILTFFRQISDAIEDVLGNIKVMLGAVSGLSNFVSVIGMVSVVAQILAITLGIKGLIVVVKLLKTTLTGGWGGIISIILGALTFISMEIYKHWNEIKNKIIQEGKALGFFKQTLPTESPMKGVIASKVEEQVKQLRGVFPEKSEEQLRLLAKEGKLGTGAGSLVPGEGGKLTLGPLTATLKPPRPKEETEAEKNAALAAAAERAASLRRQALETLRSLKEMPTETLGASEEAKAAFLQASIERMAVMDEERDAEIAKAKGNADLIDAIRKDEEAKKQKEIFNTQKAIDDSSRQFQEKELERGQELADRVSDDWDAVFEARRSKLEALTAMGIAGPGATIDLLEEEIKKYEAAVTAPMAEREKLEYQTKLNSLIAERKSLLDKIDEDAVVREDVIADKIEENFQAKLEQARFDASQGMGKRELINLLNQEIDKQTKIKELVGETDIGREAGRRVLELQQELSSLSVNVWQEASQAIGDNFVSAIEGTENPILAFFTGLAKSIRNILIRFLAEDIVESIRGAIGSRGEGKGGGGGILSSILGAVGLGGGTKETTSGGRGQSFVSSILGAVGLGRKGAAAGTSPISGIKMVPEGTPNAPGSGILLPKIGEAGGPLGPAQAAGPGTLSKFGGPALMAASILGQFIPGTAGRVISGAGTGAATGAMIGSVVPGIGTAIGAVAGGILGGISGLFGGKKKEKDPVRAEIKQWVAGELWPQLERLQKMGFGMGAFGTAHPSGTNFFKALGFTTGIPQKMLEDIKQMAERLRSVLGDALKAAFESDDAATGVINFFKTLKTGLVKAVQEGMISGLLEGSQFTKALAPFFEKIAQVSKDFAEGIIGESGFAQQMEEAYNFVAPLIEALQGPVEILANIGQRISLLITGTSTALEKKAADEAEKAKELADKAEEMAKKIKSIFENSLSSAFAASSSSSGWRNFLRGVKTGIADFVREGFIAGILKGAVLDTLLEPFFKLTEKLTRRFAKGKISEQDFGTQIQAAFKAVEPKILGLEPFIKALSSQEERITRGIMGRKSGGDLFQSIPGRFFPGGNNVNAPVTVNATINSPMDAIQTGQGIAWGLESEMRRAS